MTKDSEDYRTLFHALKGGALASSSQKSNISSKILSQSLISNRYLWLAAGFMFNRDDIEVINAMTHSLTSYVDNYDDENASALIMALSLYMDLSDQIEAQLIKAIEPHFSRKCEDSFELAASALGRLASLKRSQSILQILKKQAKDRLAVNDVNEAKVLVEALLKATSDEPFLAENNTLLALSADAVDRISFGN